MFRTILGFVCAVAETNRRASDEMDDSFDEIKKDFLNEAKQLLAETEQCFLSLEKQPSDIENFKKIFRLVHNLKGSAGAVGFSDLTEFTHKLESLLLIFKNSGAPISKGVMGLLLRANDYLIGVIDTLFENMQANYANPTLLNEIVLATEASHEAAIATAAIETSQPTIAAANDGYEVKRTPTAAMPNVATATANRSKDDNIRVSLARIEKLLNNVGELSILQTVMVQQGNSYANSLPPLMRETMIAMTKIVKETQVISMGLRMLPLKPMFSKMERIVRDTSIALNKNVELKTSGQDTEVDKSMIEQLSDPLTHIIRNAVDHGLESKELRAQTNKPEVGQIQLSASHRAGQLVIEIKDDGKGLDPNILIAKAKAKNLIAQNATLTQEEAYQLIFAPGFSTKEQVTDVSGRGVGMDVVKTNVVALQGSVQIETTLGHGTCFRLTVPLTLAIIDSLVIWSADERYVIPLSQVSEFFKPRETDMSYVYDRGELLTLRDEPMVAHRLPFLLGQSVRQKEKPASHLTALIIRSHSGISSAVLIDKIASLQQVVVKPLGSKLTRKVGIMGSAILGDGKPALIIDLFELLKSHGNKNNLKSPSVREAA